MDKDFRFVVLENGPTGRPRVAMEDLPEEHQKLLQQSDEIREETRRKIISDPGTMLTRFLEVLVNDPDTAKKVAPRALNRYPYIAKHLLASLEPKPKTDDPFISFEQYCIEDSIGWDRSIYFRLFAVDSDDFYESLYTELLESHLDHFQNSVAAACNMVYLGVPLYECDAHGNMQQVDERSDRLAFITGMGKYFYPPTEFRAAPEWTADMVFKRSDIDRHRLIFSQPNPPSPEEEDALRKAYRLSLGLSIDKRSPAENRWTTRLFDLATATVDHFQGLGRTRDRMGDWPLQKKSCTGSPLLMAYRIAKLKQSI